VKADEVDAMLTHTSAPFSLDSQESILLAQILETELAKLAVEIRHTHNRLFRDDLKRRFEMIDAILARITPAADSR
jgi:hypothetical protein